MKTNQSHTTISETHQLFLTQKAWEAHTEKIENLRCPLSPQQDNTVPLLLFLCHNKKTWVPQQPPLQPPPLTPPLPLQLQPLPLQLLHPLLLLLPLPQLLEEELSLELKTTLEMLWQLPYEEQGLGLHLEEEKVEKEEEEVAEKKVVVAEDNQLLSLCNNLSQSHWLPIYELWGCFPTSSEEKETRWTPL